MRKSKPKKQAVAMDDILRNDMYILAKKYVSYVNLSRFLLIKLDSPFNFYLRRQMFDRIVRIVRDAVNLGRK